MLGRRSIRVIASALWKKMSCKIDNCFHKCSTMLIYKIAVLLMHLQTNLVKGSCRKVQLFNDGGYVLPQIANSTHRWDQLISYSIINDTLLSN